MSRRLCGEENYPFPLLAIAGYGLPRATRAFPDEPLDDDAWSQLLSAAHANRMSGLTLAAIDAGALAVTGAQHEQARALHRMNAIRVLALDQELISVIDVLTGCGIETRVLKGSAVARLDYARPALRSFIDVDVLVRPRDIERAVRALAAEGFQRTLAEPRPGFDRRFDKGMTLIGAAGYELDLHRTFVLGPWGVRVDIDALWQGAREFSIGGHTLAALADDTRFLHACYHAALGNWPLRLASLRDVAEMVRRDDHNCAARIDLATRWGATAVVAAAIADTQRLLGIAESGGLWAWASAYEPNHREAADLALYTHPDKTFAAQAVATVRVLPRLRDKAAYVRALIAPERGYVAGRHASAFARFRYALREVQRGRGARW